MNASMGERVTIRYKQHVGAPRPVPEFHLGIAVDVLLDVGALLLDAAGETEVRSCRRRSAGAVCYHNGFEATLGRRRGSH